jgi:catalase
VKFHFKSNQGVQGMSLEQATKLAGEEPEHHTIDMWNAIERGDYPSWTFCAQVMTTDQAEKYRWNIFDMTKVWPHADFPLQPLGKLTLNRNVSPRIQHRVVSWASTLTNLTNAA